MDLRVAAYAVVRDREGKILLSHWTGGRRPAWTMPGGGLEKGEDPEVAVRRELREETGYRIAVDEILGVHSHVISASRRVAETGRAMHAIRIVYRAHVTGGRLRYEVDGSTDRAEWFTLEQVAKLQRVKLVDISLRMAGLLD